MSKNHPRNDKVRHRPLTRPRGAFKTNGLRGERKTIFNRRKNNRLHPILILFIFALCLPIELSLNLGGVLIPPYRALLIALIFPAFVNYVNQNRIEIFDIAIILLSLWMVISALVKLGLPNGIEAGGKKFVDIMGSYLVARVYLKDIRHYKLIINLLFIVVAILGALAIPEVLFKVRYLHEIPKFVTGYTYEISADERFGLLRAASTFEHPILFGLFCATTVSLTAMTAKETYQKLAKLVIILISTALSLSSAPVLVYFLQISFVFIEWITQNIKRRVFLIFATAVTLLSMIEIFSNRGIVRLVISLATINPHTGYYRILQWDHSVDDVERNPLFGIRWEEWTRPFWMTDSIDNHWLYLSLDSGLPATLLLLSTIATIIFMGRHNSKLSQEDQKTNYRLFLGWTFGIVSLSIGGITVTFFGKLEAIFLFYVGLGGALVSLSKQSTPPPKSKKHATSENQRVFSPQLQSGISPRLK